MLDGFEAIEVKIAESEFSIRSTNSPPENLLS